MITFYYHKGERKDGLARFIASKLPARIKKWAFVQVMVYATTGPYSNTEVPALTGMDALCRFEKGHPNA